MAFALSVRKISAIFGRRRRMRRGQCQNCDYDLTGNESGKYPECGAAVRMRSTVNQSEEAEEATQPDET